MKKIFALLLALVMTLSLVACGGGGEGGNTDAGKEVIAIYSHNGYQVAQASDYDNERAAQKLIQELTAAN